MHVSNDINSKLLPCNGNLREATCEWLKSKRWSFPLALTMTLKQSFAVKTTVGIRYKKLTRQDCEYAAGRFIKKLNREVFGSAAEKYGKTLSYLPVLEGERSRKNLHLHFAIGDLPSHVNYMQIQPMIINAMRRVPMIDVQHFESLADQGWIDYITKEITPTNTDAILWHLTW